jgi:hypothetical protein
MAHKHEWDYSKLPKLDNLWSAGESLGKKIETMFTRFIQRVFLWGVDFLSDRAVDIFDNSMKILQPGMHRMFDAVFDEYLKDPAFPPQIKAMIQRVKDEEGEASFAGLLVTAGMMIFGIFTGGLSPFGRRFEHITDVLVRSWTPDASMMATMDRLGMVTGDERFTLWGRAGVDVSQIDRLIELARRIPSPQETTVGMWRGVKSEADVVTDLKRLGYNDVDAKMFLELAKQIPPISDLIRMLVRDAFNDQVSSAFGYDEDFPAAINEFFEKQGYNADWAKRYWRSHWTLPSPTQAYEMLHRGLITLEDIETLLKTSDYPPFWRDKLIKISYNVMTRVDVRRLLQSGLIDESKAEQVYNQMGYNPEDARLLTEYAVLGISNEERDLTKTDILNLYEEGLIDRDTTSANLVKMGYDGEEAENILKLADVNIAKAARTDLVNYVKEKFLARLIDESGARNELTQIGLKSQSVDRYVMNWTRGIEADVALPSMADTKRWYLGELITEEKARALLTQHKHTTEHIEIYIKEWKQLLSEAEDEQPTGN